MRSAMSEYGYFEYSKRSKLCPETRLTLLSQKYVSSFEYLNAQRIRTHQMEELGKLFEQVDVIMLPTTACLRKFHHLP